MLFPARFILFWYPETLKTLVLVWRNSLQVIEEDLAVGLMYRLLFVPLYHDSTVVGRIISLFFRLSRILMGFCAYFLLTFVLVLAGIIWFGLPILVLISLFFEGLRVILPVFFAVALFGVALFVDKKLIDQPIKKVWQVKSEKEVWKATKLDPQDTGWDGLIKTKDVQDLLFSLELDPQSLKPPQVENNPQLLTKVLGLAKETGATFISANHFFMTLFLESDDLEVVLTKNGLDKKDLVETLKYIELKKQDWRKVFIWDEDFSVKHLKGVNRGWLGTPTPTLDHFCQDLTKTALSVGFDDFVGRPAQVNEVITILSQAEDRNVMLVGPAGAGKSALINYLAKLIVTGDAPDALISKRIVLLDLAGILSGVENQAELAGKIQTMFSEISYSGNIIVCIDEIHSLGIGQAGSNFNIYSLVQPFLESNNFQFIASTEPENYARIIEKNTSFARIFHKVELPPATKEETLQILINKAVQTQTKDKINITYKALKEVVALSERLTHNLVLPDSALSSLKEIIPTSQSGVITSQSVKKAFENKVKVPIIELDQSQKQTLLNLEGIIHQRMVAQHQAVKVVADTLRRSATSLRDTSRPIGSFLFVGPTGVGKTELAKTLAEVYFKNNSAFVRFDMSEYQTSEAVNRLIGTYENPGELTETVKNKPYCLILLDEFEKADPKILNLFLQVLEDGRLTDATGKTTDFSNTIIIATSNAASLIIAEGLKNNLPAQKLEEQVKAELLKVYKPELLNRFDEVVIFNSLSTEDIAKIVKIKLSEIALNLEKQGYLIQFDESIISNISQKGYDPILGARPLRRLIQDTIESDLSKLILEGKINKGEIYTYKSGSN